MWTEPTETNGTNFVTLRIKELAAERIAKAAIEKAKESSRIALYEEAKR